jgi:hypothetical protein
MCARDELKPVICFDPHPKMPNFPLNRNEAADLAAHIEPPPICKSLPVIADRDQQKS